MFSGKSFFLDIIFTITSRKNFVSSNFITIDYASFSRRNPEIPKDVSLMVAEIVFKDKNVFKDANRSSLLTPLERTFLSRVVRIGGYKAKPC